MQKCYKSLFFRSSLVLRLYWEILWLKVICPEHQQEKSPHGIQTLVVVAAHDFCETRADETVKLVNLQRLGGDGEAEGVHKRLHERQRDNRIWKDGCKMAGWQWRCVAVVSDRCAGLIPAAAIHWQPHIMTGNYERPRWEGLNDRVARERNQRLSMRKRSLLVWTLTQECHLYEAKRWVPT